MPEGDSVAGHAVRLRQVLVGRIIVEVRGTAPSVRANSGRILDATVVAVRTVGKNLIVDTDTDYSIRVHLGMVGYWRISRSGPIPHDPARVSLRTESGWAACYSAPTVDVDRTPAIDTSLARLGPDLLGAFDMDEFVRRARTRDDVSIGEMLLDQRVLAGIGNVYKSELLFLERIHPTTLVRGIDDEQLRSIAGRAQKLLAANVGPEGRSTTGSRVRHKEAWVYGRTGRTCRRCGAGIEHDRRGERVTYWCPECQPAPAAGD